MTAIFSIAQIGVYSGVRHSALAQSGLQGGSLLAAKVSMHAVAGGAFSMVQGGSFETGALTGAISAGTSFAMESTELGAIGSTEGVAVRTAVAAVAGGSASVLSGGKFANGAVTAAMGHLFNQENYAAKMWGNVQEGIHQFGQSVGSAVQSVYRAVMPGYALTECGLGGGCSAGDWTSAAATMVPMADAAFIYGGVRTIAGYQIGGTAGLVGKSYNFNIWGFYATEGSLGLPALMSAMKAEAGAAGATNISISGTSIINPGLANMNPAVASRFGLTYSKVNSTTIMLRGPVK